MGRVSDAKNCNSARELKFEVRVMENEVVEAYHECLIPCVIDTHCGTSLDNLLFSPDNEKLACRGLLAAFSLVKPLSGCFPVRLINNGETDIRLFKNTILGSLEEYQISIDTPIRQIHEIKPATTSATKPFHDYNMCQDMSERELVTVKQLINEFSDIFSKNKFDIGRCPEVKHQIFVENATPICQKIRRVPLGLEDKVDKLVEDLLEKEVIRKSSSPWNSPLVIVQKKSGDIRLCVDYRMLNSITRKSTYPIPSAEELFDTLGGSKFFSSLDLSSAYYQCEIEEEHKKLTAFGTRRGHYEFNRMPFGLTGAPFTFQHMMHIVLKAENWEQCLIYLDDILVFGRTFEQHLQRLRTIFLKIREAGIKLSPDKCNFFQSELCFLGHIISHEGIKTDPKKVEAVAEWKKPGTIQEMRSFLGFTNYYRKFIDSYASLAGPLENLMTISGKNNMKCKNKTMLQWNPEAEAIFLSLKRSLTTAPVLSFPVRGGRFILDCDASHNYLGAVLSQVQNGEERVIAYGSKKMSKCEVGYCVTRKELLSVYTFVVKFRHYLLGSNFLIRTDHKALTWLLRWKKPNTSQYCTWVAELDTYDFEIIHRPGENHINADVLSRPFQCEQCEIEHSEPKKKRNVKILDTKSTAEVRHIQKDDSLTDVSSKQRIIKSFHNGLGHIGVLKTLDLMRNKHSWRGMDNDVHDYIRNCLHCAKRKATKPLSTELDLHVQASKPFEKIMIDIAGPLPITSTGYSYILGIVDVYSRFLMLIPLRKTTTESIVDMILKRWISIFGCPIQIISDGGPNLNSRLMKDFCQMFLVEKITSSPYHPQSNGIIERYFRTVKDMIYAVCKDTRKEWHHTLPHIEMALRATKHQTTGFSPFEIIFGNKMKIPQLIGTENLNPTSYNDYMITTNASRKVVAEILRQKVRTIDSSEKAPKFIIGQQVMVKKPFGNKPSVLQARYFGPCIVLKIVGPKTYQLLFNNCKIIRNSDLLKPFSSKAIQPRLPSITRTQTSVISHSTVSINEAHQRTTSLLPPQRTEATATTPSQSNKRQQHWRVPMAPTTTEEMRSRSQVPTVVMPRQPHSTMAPPRRVYPLRTHKPPCRFGYSQTFS